jgi:hypothetical protein
MNNRNNKWDVMVTKKKQQEKDCARVQNGNIVGDTNQYVSRESKGILNQGININSYYNGTN